MVTGEFKNIDGVVDGQGINHNSTTICANPVHSFATVDWIDILVDLIAAFCLLILFTETNNRLSCHKVSSKILMMMLMVRPLAITSQLYVLIPMFLF